VVRMIAKCELSTELLQTQDLRYAMDQFATKRNAQELCIRYVSGPRNQFVIHRAGASKGPAFFYNLASKASLNKKLSAARLPAGSRGRSCFPLASPSDSSSQWKSPSSACWPWWPQAM